MTAASAAEAKRAMISFDEFPKLVDSDSGPEFRGEFEAWLASKNIAHRVKDPKDLNSLATVDRKIQAIKDRGTWTLELVVDTGSPVVPLVSYG